MHGSGVAGFHDRAVLVSSGDEIITGQLLDTNAQFFARSLTDLGVLPAAFFTVPDELDALVRTIRQACAIAPLVIVSGGLGPTEGDLTRQALATVLGTELTTDEGSARAIEAMLLRRGRPVTERQLRQALRPKTAECLANAVGTAPGLHATVHGDGRPADVFCLPGPPGELRPMWRDAVLPRLRLNPGRVMMTRLLHIVGVPEAEAVGRLGDLTKRTQMPLVGITASGGILTLRIRFESGSGATREDAARAVDAAEQRARRALGDHVFAVGDAAVGHGVEFLVRTVLSQLQDRSQRLSVVESCTGGMLGEMITAIPGSSAGFIGGEIVYDNAVKAQMGVQDDTLALHGAVSAQAVKELATLGVSRFGSDHALAISGVAGPDGGSDTKPVGTVFVARASRGSGGLDIDVRRFLFAGDREDVRKRASVTALAMLYFHLKGSASGDPKLLWEVPC